jgi:hypothetical protein
MMVGFMFRSLALLIVLVVPVAQDASVLCQTWCSRQAETSTTCHHEDDSATRVLNAQTCDTTSLQATLVPARGQRASGAASGLVTLLASPAASLHSERRNVNSISSRPAVPAFTLLTVLRI